MTYLILITGSRTWDDWETIRTALGKEYLEHEDAVMINGDCPQGADYMAKELWKPLPIRLFPADWDKYGKRAGFIRNAEMVALNPDICLAFIKDNSKGATMTANLAEKAGIKTIRFTA